MYELSRQCSSALFRALTFAQCIHVSSHILACSFLLGACIPGVRYYLIPNAVLLLQAIQQATKLELLQYGQHAASAPTLGDMHIISQLPALQKACLGVKDPGFVEATKFVARNCLPRLRALKVGVEQGTAPEGVWTVEEFLEEAAALLEAELPL